MTLAFVSDMKKLVSSDQPLYKVCVSGNSVFTTDDLLEATEFIDRLSQQFYENGQPDPSTITLEEY